MMLQMLLVAGTLIVLSGALTKIYALVAIKKGIFALPNERSAPLHNVPTPRGAGATFMGLWLLLIAISWGLGIIPAKDFFIFFPAVSLLVVVGFLDDLHPLPVRFRLLLQLGVALLLSAVVAPWQWLLLTVPCIVWAINLFNFMDGLDGFAGIESIFILLFEALLFHMTGYIGLSLVFSLLACCVAGFLIFNWPKASVFMGDCGSYGLGLVIVLGALYGQMIVEVAIVYGVFLFDASITVWRRMLRKQNITQAHTLHAFQRLNHSGVSNIDLLYGLIIINSVLFVLAFCAFKVPAFRYYIFALAYIILTAIYLYIESVAPLQMQIDKSANNN